MDKRIKDCRYDIPTVPVGGELVGGSVLKAGGGRGAYLPGESEGDSQVPGPWDVSGGEVAEGPSAEPKCTGREPEWEEAPQNIKNCNQT